ncbi:MAG: sulfotransferase [Gammaproteobacteria bacterium]
MAVENRYGFVDRLLHRLSFRTVQAQIDLAHLEERFFADQLANVEVRRPVFIAALPRAGTTLLLELFAGLDEFATHCYRDMPFVLLPLVWNRFSSAFRLSNAPQERAHGDGMLVNIDSPEALEEIIWKAMWPDHYEGDRIKPWEKGRNPIFLEYFTNHVRKILKLRQRNPEAVPRYASKNNANIARIEWLANAFPDAVFVVPFRDAAQHAGSLLHQHKNFLGIHAKQGFAREYMDGIGHYDFGATLRPIDFNGWLATASHPDPMTIGFWMEYWSVAYEYVLDKPNPNIYFLSYESLCAFPQRGLDRLSELLSIEHRREFSSKGAEIRLRTPHSVDLSTVDAAVLSRANEVCARLREKAIAVR